jgi:transposase
MYSDERKHLVLRAHANNNNLSIRTLAQLFSVSKTTVHRWISENRKEPQEFSVQEKERKLDKILALIDYEYGNDPFQTALRLKKKFSQEHDIHVSIELIRVGTKLLGLSRKKARYYGVAKNALSLNAKFLRRRDEYIKQGAKLYSIDETGFGRFSYMRSYGYCKKGVPLMIRKDKARVTSTTVIACASEDGWTARHSLKGGLTRNGFCEFIQSLDLPQGSVLLLDNASIHKGDQAFNTFKNKGFIPLYVPPYSPWYNPIEKCFSIVKRVFGETQNIDESFNSLTKDTHFVPFFRKSLSCYGLDEKDAIDNRAEMMKKQENECDDNVKKKKEPKPKKIKVDKSEDSTVEKKKVKQQDGSTVTTITTVKTTTIVRKRINP